MLPLQPAATRTVPTRRAPISDTKSRPVLPRMNGNLHVRYCARIRSRRTCRCAPRTLWTAGTLGGRSLGQARRRLQRPGHPSAPIEMLGECGGARKAHRQVEAAKGVRTAPTPVRTLGARARPSPRGPPAVEVSPDQHPGVFQHPSSQWTPDYELCISYLTHARAPV